MTCPKCGATCGANDPFCRCGERLSDGNMVNEARASLREIASSTTGLRERIEALEVVRQRIQTCALDDPLDAPAVRRTERNGFRSLGDFLLTLVTNRADPRLTALDTRALSTLPGSAGGFLIPAAFSDELMVSVTAQSIVRPRARIIPSDPSAPDLEIDLPTLDYTAGKRAGVTVSWLAEAATKPETQPVFASIHLRPQEIGGHVVLSDKLLRNSPAASMVVAHQLSEAIAYEQDLAFLSGNGVGRPLGVRGHASVVNVVRGGAGLVAYADLAAMFGRLKASSRSRAVWVVSQTTLPQLMVMATAPGQLVWQTSAREGMPGTMLGCPVVTDEAAPVLGQSGDILLADFGWYLVKDGTQLRVQDDQGLSHFTTNQTVIKAFAAVDGQPWLTAPLLLDDGATTVSPFVSLV